MHLTPHLLDSEEARLRDLRLSLEAADLRFAAGADTLGRVGAVVVFLLLCASGGVVAGWAL